MSGWIVIVDDDIINLKTARDILREKDMKVSTAKSGKDFLKFMESKRPDLVLLDIRMPDMDGFEVYDKLRELEAFNGEPSIPVIFLTAEEDGSIENKCLGMGAADFVRKPFHRDVLLRRIENVMKNKQTIHNLTMDATTDKLTGFLNKESSVQEMRRLCKTEHGALIILDLDSFKLVNDLYGHDMGDQILVSFADIIRKNLRAVDVVGRIGGDEFIVFGENIPYESVVDNIVKRINTQLIAKAKELMGDDCNIPLGVSAGTVFVPDEGGEYDELFKQADKALYYVKKNGKHGYAVYNSDPAKEQEEPEQMTDSLDRLSQIMDERGEASNSLMLGQEAFMNVYRFMIRYIYTYQRIAHKALFTIKPINVEFSGSNLTEMYDHFEEILKKNLRKSDFMMRSKPNQFFVLLPELAEQHRDIVLDRIIHAWNELGYEQSAELIYEHEIIDGTHQENVDSRRAQDEESSE